MDTKKHGSINLTLIITHPMENRITVCFEKDDVSYEVIMKKTSTVSELYSAAPTVEEWRQIELNLKSRLKRG